MCHINIRSIHSQSYNFGFSLIITIFMLWITSSVIMLLLYISNSQHFTNSQIIQGQRGIQAAYSAIEWGISKIIQTKSCFNQNILNFNTAGLKNFTVYVACNEEAPNYQITATAVYSRMNQPPWVIKQISLKYPRSTLILEDPK